MPEVHGRVTVRLLRDSNARRRYTTPPPLTEPPLPFNGRTGSVTERARAADRWRFAGGPFGRSGRVAYFTTFLC